MHIKTDKWTSDSIKHFHCEDFSELYLKSGAVLFNSAEWFPNWAGQWNCKGNNLLQFNPVKNEVPI